MEDETITTEVTTEAANVSGEVESAGTPDQSVDSGETPTVTETQKGTEETQQEATTASPDSLPANERIQQLIARDKDREAKINALQSKLSHIEQQTQAVKPDFVDIDVDKVNNHIITTLDKIDELRLEGRALEAMELQDGLNELRTQIRANEQRKQAFFQRQQQTHQTQEMAAQLNQRIAEASEIVRNDAGITPEVWKEGELFFAAERQAKPLLDAQYREIAMLQGPIAGLLFAKEYVMKNMGQKQVEATKQKEAEKNKAATGKTSTGVASLPDLGKLKEQAAKTGSEEDFLAYLAAKRQHKQAEA